MSTEVVNKSTNAATVLLFKGTALEVGGTAMTADAILNMVAMFTDDAIFLFENFPSLIGLSKGHYVVDAQEGTVEEPYETVVLKKLKSYGLIVAVLGTGAIMTFTGKYVSNEKTIGLLNKVLYKMTSDVIDMTTHAAMFSSYGGATLYITGTAFTMMSTVYAINVISKGIIYLRNKVIPNLVEDHTVTTVSSSSSSDATDTTVTPLTTQQKLIKRGRSYLLVTGCLIVGTALVFFGQNIHSDKAINWANNLFYKAKW